MSLWIPQPSINDNGEGPGLIAGVDEGRRDFMPRPLGALGGPLTEDRLAEEFLQK